MSKNLAILAVLVFAPASVSAGAETWSHAKTGVRTHHHRRAATENHGDYGGWSASGASHQGGEADCPNGDCRGLNSPGNLGGAHEW